ncbi:hypothetical protein COB55_04525 [Candidatus Wolfebacteria bacterium]|nr:MAG: hypothetical protein COB55_04525 [Candidatus Wolfebacteria bacterium]
MHTIQDLLDITDAIALWANIFGSTRKIEVALHKRKAQIIGEIAIEHKVNHVCVFNLPPLSNLGETANSQFVEFCKWWKASAVIPK